jgi:CDP-diacylglycerol--glycerol-3-phosphate 3-phosphatidyltransferase
LLKVDAIYPQIDSIANTRSVVTYIPNFLTILRGFAGPWILWLFYTGGIASPGIAALAFSSLLLASFTDYLDGVLARAFNAESKLGAMLDPWADKILVLSVFAILPTLDAELYPWWLFAIIASRELLMEGIRAWRRSKRHMSHEDPSSPLALPVQWSGKVKTTAQMIFIHLALGLHLLDLLPYPAYVISGPILSSWAMFWLYIGTAVLTVWSGLDTLRSSKPAQ